MGGVSVHLGVNGLSLVTAFPHGGGSSCLSNVFVEQLLSHWLHTPQWWFILDRDSGLHLLPPSIFLAGLRMITRLDHSVIVFLSGRLV